MNMSNDTCYMYFYETPLVDTIEGIRKIKDKLIQQYFKNEKNLIEKEFF